MIYPENPEDAKQIAESALTEMAAAKVPATPPNYTIWFDHVSGRNPALSRIIKQAQTKNIVMTSERNHELYERYCDHGAGESDQISADQINSIASHIANALTEVGKSTEKYGAALATASGSLNDAASGADITDVTDVIKDILSETHIMGGQVRDLQQKVAESQSEILSLREDLEASQRKAMTDGLTGLANRRSFDESINRLVAVSRADSSPLSLIICDIDHFKLLNDTHGHQTGDQVLRLIGRTLTDCTKGRDVAARYGGEEFALILPETDIRGAQSLAETLRKTLATRKLAKKGSNETLAAVTMSFGVTEQIIGEPVETFINRADAHMYQAKHEGRNRVSAGVDMPEIKKAS